MSRKHKKFKQLFTYSICIGAILIFFIIFVNIFLTEIVRSDLSNMLNGHVCPRTISEVRVHKESEGDRKFTNRSTIDRFIELMNTSQQLGYSPNINFQNSVNIYISTLSMGEVEVEVVHMTDSEIVFGLCSTHFGAGDKQYYSINCKDITDNEIIKYIFSLR